MEYISRRMRRLRKMRCPRKMRRLKKMRRRAVKFWRERCPSVRRRKRFIRGVLFLLAACTAAWAKTGLGMKSWVREQVPYMERIEECGPVRAADRDGMTSVKRGFTIRLDEKKIHIFQVEEGYEDRETAIDSGSD